MFPVFRSINKKRQAALAVVPIGYEVGWPGAYCNYVQHYWGVDYR